VGRTAARAPARGGFAVSLGDLGEARLEDGQKEKERYRFQQAQELAPNLPPVWMRPTFFHFQMEETETAIRWSASVLKTVPDYRPGDLQLLRPPGAKR
jgi:hypothetical protein